MQCADAHKSAAQIRLRLLVDGFRFGAEKHNDVSDAGDKVAVRFFGKLRSQSFLFFFEIVELDLEQFGMGERLIQGDEERGTKAFLADLERCFEPLCATFQLTDLGVGQSFHRQNLTQLSPNARKSGAKAFPCEGFSCSSFTTTQSKHKNEVCWNETL